jgi:hypothetical protein
MQADTATEKLDQRELTVKLSYNKSGDHFFIDLWDNDKYIVSIKLSELQCLSISKEIGVKIFE